MKDMAKLKPILFNTDMVEAIQDGRKTVTRRIVKNVPNNVYAGRCVLGAGLFDEATHMRVVKPTIEIGDILYVRETWGYNRDMWLYKANYPEHEWPLFIWHPSIHMPKKIARIFLRVKDVRAERLQDITEVEALAEGIWKVEGWPDTSRFTYTQKHIVGRVWSTARDCFMSLWNSTIKKEYLDTTGWKANPWVWVIEFEKISKEEAMKC